MTSVIEVFFLCCIIATPVLFVLMCEGKHIHLFYYLFRSKKQKEDMRIKKHLLKISCEGLPSFMYNLRKYVWSIINEIHAEKVGKITKQIEENNGRKISDRMD